MNGLLGTSGKLGLEIVQQDMLGADLAPELEVLPAPAAAPEPALPGPDATPAAGTDPAPLPEAEPETQIEPAQPAQETPEEVARRLGLPPPATGLPPAPSGDLGFWSVADAAWTRETIVTDAWGYRNGQEQALAMEMWDLLGDEGKTRIMQPGGTRQSMQWATMAELVVAEAARQAAIAPEVAQVFAGYPLSMDAFRQRIDTDLRATLEEQDLILAAGGALPGFVGSMGRAMTDPASVALMPLGVGGAPLRVIAGEMLLGALGEAAVLPREYEVAEQLGLPDPDPLTRIGLGAVMGGGLAGGIIGATRGGRWLLDRSIARNSPDAKPEGMAGAEWDLEVEAAEAAMAGQPTVAEAVGDVAEKEPAAVSPGGFSSVAEAGKGYTVVIGPDGQAIRREGTRAWRNNNPGNIEYGPFARSMGAIGTDGRFAVFPSYEAGRAAKRSLLWSSRGYRGKTIAGAISRYAPSFENNTRSYINQVARAIGVSPDTPMASLTPAQRDLMLNAMERVEGFRPGKENGVQVAGPRRGMAPELASEDIPDFGGTSRGYTGGGQISAGDGFRIDVDFDVVDVSALIRASGDLQPRDRSRITSDAWIADTAARLDPAQLMPSPTADRGTPIIGPDNVIESGNGRYGAIARAYERHPDRALAYRSQIEAAGFAIPEGVERPVLVARRRSDLSHDDRVRFAIEAQDSGVAVMTPTEIAQTSSRAMTAPVLTRLDPAQPLRAEGNAEFVRAALAQIPRSARNAMFDGSGMLNSAGERQLREAIFARAWPDPDILARHTEGDAGELKSLMEALERAAPSWAALKADIEAGLVAPEMDISDFVLDAMRLIGAARELAASDRKPIAKAIAQLLDSEDLFAGAISPLTSALVRRLWKNGRAASADDVTGFLTRYAEDARKAGATGSLLDAPTPRDVLRAIDPEIFGDLPEDMGAARGYARPSADLAAEAEAVSQPVEGWDAGAISREAEAADQAILADLDPARLHEPDPEAEAETRAIAEARAELGEEFLELDFEPVEGIRITTREALDDLEADRAADAALDACLLNPATTFAKGATA